MIKYIEPYDGAPEVDFQVVFAGPLFERSFVQVPICLIGKRTRYTIAPPSCLLRKVNLIRYVRTPTYRFGCNARKSIIQHVQTS